MKFFDIDIFASFCSSSLDKTATEPAAKKRLEFDQPPSCRPKRKKVAISKTKRAGLVFSVPKITKKIKVSGSHMFGQISLDLPFCLLSFLPSKLSSTFP